MRLIFIRHAEPDYPNNSLTEKGFREAELLSERIKNWKVDRFYASPLARAVLTAVHSLDKLGLSEQDLIKVDWMKEFSYMIMDPTTGKTHVPWDFMPSWWTQQEHFYDPFDWYVHPIFRSADGYTEAVRAMRKGINGILEEYGYYRSGAFYHRDDKKTAGDDEKTVVFFGHLGANLEAIGYLLGISPVVLQQGIYLAPSSVTIINMDKRLPGDAMPRAQCIGDTSHLQVAGEPLSASGAFSPVMNN